MLEFAWKYKDSLERTLCDTLTDDDYKFVNVSYNDVREIQRSDWNYRQRVSTRCGKGLAFLSAAIDRASNSVTQVTVISIKKMDSSERKTFTKDLLKFLMELYTEYRKVSFTACPENHVHDRWVKYVLRVGGRIVGTKEQELLVKGQYYDETLFEILDMKLAYEETEKILKSI